MAIKCIGQKWCPDARDYSKELILDTEADVSALPECCPGSTALVCSTGEVRIVNASGQWVVFGEEA